ncbi:hypothetical protein EWM64_g7115 [Hericium alpestre]|uniref:CFEM domain-containing protein n=1 Tax=Hericium alpestre TaxID=135208 RepID=A0A4Y9ZRK9_9AGAM|nr:hypothetical protein EWM64_g7115 [Hericium alpestre]
MRFALAIVAAVASTASASNLLASRQAGYPNCALPCLASANFGSCGTTDLKCLCASNDFISSVTNCIVGACQGSDLTNAEGAAQSECAAVVWRHLDLDARRPDLNRTLFFFLCLCLHFLLGLVRISSLLAYHILILLPRPSPSPSTASNSNSNGALMTGPNLLAGAAALGAAVLAL